MPQAVKTEFVALNSLTTSPPYLHKRGRHARASRRLLEMLHNFENFSLLHHHTFQIDSRRAALKAAQQADFVSNALLNELQRNVFVMLSWDHTSRC